MAARTHGVGARSLLGRGMWIWHLERSEGGNLAAIVARAHAAGLTTVLVKSSDGARYWSQFSPQLVRTLHAGRLHVCAWQYVYGSDPIGEAAMGIRAVHTGADCLVIDAEATYEGRYAAAQSYLRHLRAAVGRHFAVGLASYPYVDYHPSFPYSVFLGRGGAQFDLPQMYWKDIGTSIDQVFAHTFTSNRIYGRPILPLGQTYGSPSATEIGRFRALTLGYHARGISWWDWAWTSASRAWAWVGAGLASVLGSARGTPTLPLLGQGARGDQVLWVQEHLARMYRAEHLTGVFGSQTLGYLRAFQARRRLPVTGRTDYATWRALLRLSPVTVSWAAPRPSVRGRASRLTGHPARRPQRTGPDPRRVRGSAGGTRAGPASASLPALGYEIPPPGAEPPDLGPAS